MKVKIEASGVPLDDLSTVVSWRVGSIRERITKEVIDAVYIVHPEEVELPNDLSEQIKELRALAGIAVIAEEGAQDSGVGSVITKEILSEIVHGAIRRSLAGIAAEGLLSKVSIVSAADKIEDKDVKKIDARQELRDIARMDEKIKKETSIVDGRRHDISRALSEAIAPEFNYLDVSLTKLRLLFEKRFDGASKALEAKFAEANEASDARSSALEARFAEAGEASDARSKALEAKFAEASEAVDKAGKAASKNLDKKLKGMEGRLADLIKSRLPPP